MGWDAQTQSAGFQKGMHIRIEESQRADELNQVVQGASLAIQVGSTGAFIRARVVSASESEAVIQLIKEKTCWKMTHLEPREYHLTGKRPEPFAQLWAVREEVDCPA